MKKTKYIAFGLLIVALAGCKKYQITQAGSPATSTQIKLINVAPGLGAVDGYINTKQVTPETSISVTDNSIPVAITTGFYFVGNTIFREVYPGANYLSAPSGSTAIKIVASTPVPALTSPQPISPGTVISDITQATTDGSAYSAFVIGLPGSATTGLTTKIVPDNFAGTDATKAYVRFINAVPNGAPYDLQATYTPTGGVATTSVVTTNTAYPNITDFTVVSVNPISTTNYTFQMYLTGTTNKFGAISSTIVLQPGRYYTIIGRGLAVDYAIPNTNIVLKATARPTLPVTDPNTKLPELYFNAPGITSYTNK